VLYVQMREKHTKRPSSSPSSVSSGLLLPRTRDMEKRLFNAAIRGDTAAVAGILRTCPAIDVNWRSEAGWAPLHAACEYGHNAIVVLLMSHPEIDPNRRDSFGGRSPLFWACVKGSTACVRLLLRDPRVRVLGGSDFGYTPLRWAAGNGHVGVVERWIASGREVDLGRPGNPLSDALGAARWQGMTEVAELLNHYRRDPAKARHEARLRLGCQEELAADVFALLVFLCDDLVTLPLAEAATPPQRAAATRFFAVARRLPMDVQMVLCHRSIGSPKTVITGNASELAFQALGRTFVPN